MTKNYYGIIYIITNLINNKQYVGKTTWSLKSRWGAHKRKARADLKKNYTSSLISNSINKYDPENFKIEMIDNTAQDKIELKELETLYIIAFDSLHPNGLNIKLEHDGGYPLTPEIKLIISKQRQGIKINRKKRYCGVRKQNNGYLCYIHYLGEKHTKMFKTAKEAATAYDKMIMFLFKGDCKLNLPEDKENYEKENLQEYFIWFKAKEKVSKFLGVSKNKKRDKWIAFLCIKDKFTNIGYYKNEIDAAEARDIKYLEIFPESNNLNFPEKKQQYLNKKITIKPNYKTRKTHNKYKGVSKHQNTNLWRCRIQLNGKIYLKYFSSEIEAAKHYNEKALEIFGNKAKLNKI